MTGVYDLALCNSETSQPGALCCALDVEDEQVSEEFWQGPDVLKALEEGSKLGLELTLQARWQRLA